MYHALHHALHYRARLYQQQVHLDALIKVHGVVTRRVYPQLNLVKFTFCMWQTLLGPFQHNTNGTVGRKPLTLGEKHSGLRCIASISCLHILVRMQRWG